MDTSRAISEEYGDYLLTLWDAEEKAKADKQFVDFMVEEMDPTKFNERHKADMEEVVVDIEEVNRLNRNVSSSEGKARRSKLWNGRV